MHEPSDQFPIPLHELQTIPVPELVKKYKVSRTRINNYKQRQNITLTATGRRKAYGDRDDLLRVLYDEDIPDPETPEAFNELLEAVVAAKAVQKKYDPRRHKIGLTLPGKKPVGIVFSGDWQLGSMGVDYALWRDDMRLLLDTHKADPTGLYAIGMGDYSSALGTLNIRGSQYKDIIPPGYQIGLCRGLFRMSKGLWLVLLAGCHDTFTKNASDQDTIQDFVSLSGSRHGWHGLEAEVKLDRESYIFRLRHKFGGGSKINPLSAQRRQAEFEGPADVIAHAHLHTSVIGEMPAAGRDTVMLRSGSYQIHDDFARQQVGNVKADPRFPMVIVFPDSHRVWACRDFKEGLDYLAMLRR